MAIMLMVLPCNWTGNIGSSAQWLLCLSWSLSCCIGASSFASASASTSPLCEGGIARSHSRVGPVTTGWAATGYLGLVVERLWGPVEPSPEVLVSLVLHHFFCFNFCSNSSSCESEMCFAVAIHTMPCLNSAADIEGQPYLISLTFYCIRPQQGLS